MSKPKQWKQVREMKHADVWGLVPLDPYNGQIDVLTDDQAAELIAAINAYPQEAEQPDRLWVGSGDSV